MIRRLLVAVSALCFVATIALVIMWPRSYRTADRLHCPLSATQSLAVASKQGRVVLVRYEQGKQPNQWQTGRYSHPITDNLTFPHGDVRQYESAFSFGFVERPVYAIPEMTFPMPNKPPGWTKTFNGGFRYLRGSALIAPYWCSVLLLPILGVALLLKRPIRFGLRSLFLALSFVAGVLGIAAALDN